MDGEKLEHMLQVVQSGQKDVPNEVINEYNTEIMNFQLSQEGFLWCISNFSSLQSEHLILFALRVFKTWISSNWESLTSEMIDELRQILFFQSKLTSDVYSVTQSSAQFSLFEKLYPENWPVFWDDLLKLNSNIVLSFLQQFAALIGDMEESIKINIQMQMQMDESEKNVVQYIILKIDQGNKKALSILDQMLEWINPALVLESSVISIIQQDLNSSIEYISNYSSNENSEEEDKPFLEKIDELESAIKMLIGLVNNQYFVDQTIDPSVIGELLSQFSIIDKMILVCQNENFKSVMGSASNLISSCARFFENTSDAPQYYQLCLLLLAHSSTDAVEQIIRFISDFTEKSEDDEVAQNSFQALSNRLSTYFTDKPTEIDDFASSLLKAINTILSNNKGMLDAYLEAFINSCGDLSSMDPLSLSAMFNIIIDAVQDGIQFAKRNEVAILFVPPLIESVSPPYEDPVYYAVSSYMTFLLRIAEKYDLNNPDDYPPVSVFQAMFIMLLNNLVIDYDMDDDYKKEKFIDITDHFINTKLFKAHIAVASEQLFSLVETADFFIINIGSKMLQKFEISERTEIFSNCMQMMMSSVQSEDTPNERKQDIIQSMLKMIEKLSSKNENSEIAQTILQYMEKILPTAASNGQIMSDFLQTLYGSFGSNGLNLLLSIINDGIINDMQGLSKACEISTEYIKKDLNDASKLKWVNDCVNKLLDETAQMIQEVSDWSTDISDETKQAVSLLQHFFILVTQSSHFLSDELNTKLLSFTGEIFPVLFQLKNKFPIYHSIKYLSSLLNSPMYQKNTEFLSSTLVDNFIPLTFQIFTSEHFNLESGDWRKTIYSVLEFHQILLKTVHEMAALKITEIFNQFPQSSMNEQAMNAYIQQLYENTDDNTKLFAQIKDVFQYIKHITDESSS